MTNNKADILVVIPVMNRATLITTALDAVLNQTLQPNYLVVVDDCSSDNTTEVIRNWKDKVAPHFEMKLIVQPRNMGASVARNLGMASISGDYRYIYFLDSDDIPPQHFLQQTTTALRLHPDAVAATTDRILKDENGEAKFFNHKSLSTNPCHWFLEKGAGIASATLFRADLIKQLGGYNAALLTGHDCELFFRLANLGRWLYVPACPVTIREHQSHLRDMHDDPIRKWCHIYENCIDNFAKQSFMPRQTYRRLLARNWRYAGLEILAQRRNIEARDCFRRSLSWSITDNIQSLIYLVSTPAISWILASLNKIHLHDWFMNTAKRMHLQHRFRL